MTRDLGYSDEPLPCDSSSGTDGLRFVLRQSMLAAENQLVQSLIKDLIEGGPFDEKARVRISKTAESLVAQLRSQNSHRSFMNAFLTEYGLSNREGDAVMRLAEALIRTPDGATADALIADKIREGNWSVHDGASDAWLVNLATKGLKLAALWMKLTNPKSKRSCWLRQGARRLGDPVLRHCVCRAMNLVGSHYVFGETITDALSRMKPYKLQGNLFSFDMLGEGARTEADALGYTESYESGIRELAAHSSGGDLYENPSISVKLSALHARFEYSQRNTCVGEILDRLKPLVHLAKNANMGLTLDAEECERLDLTLAVLEGLFCDPDIRRWPGLGVVVQAYQRRAPALIDWLAEQSRVRGERLPVRLVKGAYWDGEIKRAQVLGLRDYPVFTRKASTDVSYLACADKLLRSPELFYPQIATHNAYTVCAVLEMANIEKQDGKGRFEFQRLFGMGKELHEAVMGKYGVSSRIYAPVGHHKELLAYLMRRLLENGANSSFVSQLYDVNIPLEDVVADPVSVLMSKSALSNPAIPRPSNLHAEERLSAYGWDLTDPLIVEQIEAGLEKVQALECRASPHINGKVIEGSCKTVVNPAFRNSAIGKVIDAQIEHVDQAAESAALAVADWAALKPQLRSNALCLAADLLEERFALFVHLVIAEAGKNWADAIGEIREAVDFCRYYAARAQDSDLLERVPLGVVACISPWNFPLAIFIGQVTGALAAGNAVVAKPAEQTPLIAAEAVKLLHEAGVPGNVLHLLPGDGEVIGAQLVAHKAISGVCFTGSTQTAKRIQRILIDNGNSSAPFIAETGGINAMIVDSTALLEQAVDDIISSAFNSAGQRCSALRILCVQSDIADELLQMLAGAMDLLCMGDPRHLSTDVGPVIDEVAFKDLKAYVSRMKEKGLLVAETALSGACEDGYFVPPVVFEVASIGDVSREVFGPVLHVVRYDVGGLDGIIDEINALGYGLTLGIQSRIDATADQIIKRMRVGNIYVNRNQIGAVVGMQPFGGEGLSGTGPKAGGPYYLRRLTKPFVIEQDERPVSLTVTADKAQQSDLKRFETMLGIGQQAQLKWQKMACRQSILWQAVSAVEACGSVASEPLCQAVEDMGRFYDPEIKLPAPTGERNTLGLHGRGVFLCLGGDEKVSLVQAVRSLSAKNAVVIAVPEGRHVMLSRFQSTLERAGAPKGLFNIFVCSTPKISSEIFSIAGISGVVFDGVDAMRTDLARILADKSSAILPLLSCTDDPERFAVERVVTINTTAAGGNVELLSMMTDS